MIITLEWTDAGVRFIDQTKLPTEETYITATNYQQVAESAFFKRTPRISRLSAADSITSATSLVQHAPQPSISSGQSTA